MTINKAQPVFGTFYDIGWIGFTRTFDALGDAIAYGEARADGSAAPSVNHALVVIDNNLCVQAHINDGVQPGKISDYLDDPKSRVYFRKPLVWTPQLGKSISAAAIGKIGCHYGKDLIVEMALADSELGHVVNELFRNWPHHVLSQALSRPNQFICSQLAAYALASQPEYRECPLLKNPLASIDPQSLFEHGPFEDFINAALS